MIKIKYKIEEMRLLRNISKNELTRRTGLTFAQVAGICNLKESAAPKLTTLVKYAEALNCSVKDLFEETNE
jgi:DNA-binding Xre family transcriptional regulator